MSNGLWIIMDNFVSLTLARLPVKCGRLDLAEKQK